jgi:asparagine synthase (glutamine-hydrolysing)
MCGIAGLIVPISSLDPQAALYAMAQAIAHRGPDDEGFFFTTTAAASEAGQPDGRYRIGLAHRRLSIIDLSTGHQPMCNEDADVWIVFNGEVYNFQALRAELIQLGHVFVTSSDTETVVHAYEQWGEACVEYFRGMFAFAIWDARRQRLFLARDRFGKKPLFFCEHEGSLIFASEVKAILTVPGVEAAVDLDSVWDYFSFRYAPAPGTLFKNIRKLGPGCYAVWEGGKLTETRYYQPPDSLPRVDSVLPDDPVATFLTKLDEAVQIRMVSDVPFGAFLSGGLDSAAVVALMSRHATEPVKTFSVGFTEAAYSELNYARAVAKEFGTEHHEFIVSVDQVISLLPKLVRFRDAPVAEPSDIPIYLLAKEARKTVKMVLTGEGADEFLGGYPKHVYESFVPYYQSIPRWLRHGILDALANALPYRFQRAKTGMINLGLDSFEERMPRWFGALSNRERSELIAMQAPVRTGETVQSRAAGGNSALRRILSFDQTSWLPDNLLERGDSMTMAASLEGRMPFIDHELAAYVSSLPDKYRVHRVTTKWILRQAMQPILPEVVLNRPKVGFRVPVNEWFRGPMRDYLYAHLTGSASMTKQYCHPAVMERILAEHVDGRRNHEKLLWSLLNLEIWHRQYL